MSGSSVVRARRRGVIGWLLLVLGVSAAALRFVDERAGSAAPAADDR